MKAFLHYLNGESLYGDNFSLEQITQWFEEEREAYATLAVGKKKDYRYGYHYLNQFHAAQVFRSDRYFERVLGMGSAFGDEFLPIKERIGELTIIEPSEQLSHPNAEFKFNVSYKIPNICGEIDFPSNYFHLISCLGVLHHIPNVSFVFSELARVLAPGGYLLIREPIVSMGDWTKKRRGLTKNERGIPLHIFDGLIENCKLQVVKRSLCIFPPIPKFSDALGFPAFNAWLMTFIDKVACQLLRNNIRYHPKVWMHRFRPTNIFYVLTKGEHSGNL